MSLLCRVKQHQNATVADARPVDEHSVAFLLAEYTMIRELRAATISLIEARTRFVGALQTGVVAIVGLLLSRSTPLVTVAIVAIAVGAPTLLLLTLRTSRQPMRSS